LRRRPGAGSNENRREPAQAVKIEEKAVEKDPWAGLGGGNSLRSAGSGSGKRKAEVDNASINTARGPSLGGTGSRVGGANPGVIDATMLDDEGDEDDDDFEIAGGGDEDDFMYPVYDEDGDGIIEIDSD
jgi:hypothetical protein